MAPLPDELEKNVTDKKTDTTKNVIFHGLCWDSVGGNWQWQPKLFAKNIVDIRNAKFQENKKCEKHEFDLSDNFS